LEFQSIAGAEDIPEKRGVHYIKYLYCCLHFTLCMIYLRSTMESWWPNSWYDQASSVTTIARFPCR